MNRLSILSIALVACSASSFAQVSGTFNFANPNNAPSETFTTNNGFSVVATGLKSAQSLNQNLAHVTLNASLYNLKSGEHNGLGTGPDSDHELRNGSSGLSGATLIELSHISGPHMSPITALDFVMASVDYSTHEGYLIYGSNQSAANGGHADLTLLHHGYGNQQGYGYFNVSSSELSHFQDFYVTSDNGCKSSVLLGSGTKATTQAVPEPASFATLLVGLPALLRRRKRSSK